MTRDVLLYASPSSTLDRTKVGEDDYHQLKHDQCLRVDFNSFPRKFIELLQSCRGAGGCDSLATNPEPGSSGTSTGGSDSRTDEARLGRGDALSAEAIRPSFLARLETLVPGGFSVFSLVETNPFKELTHLSLKFRAGNDAAIKTYLAARLRQVSAGQAGSAFLFDEGVFGVVLLHRWNKIISLYTKVFLLRRKPGTIISDTCSIPFCYTCRCMLGMINRFVGVNLRESAFIGIGDYSMSRTQYLFT